MSLDAKIDIAGDSDVGKTSIAHRLKDIPFTPCTAPTNVVDFSKYSLNLSNMEINFKVWDVSGLERYRAIAKSYFHGADGFILVFSLNNIDSFYGLNDWIGIIKEYGPSGVPIVLVGNKSDDTESRVVEKEEAQKFAKEHNFHYIESSCKTDYNIVSIFHILGNYIIQRHEQSKEDVNEEKTPPLNKIFSFFGRKKSIVKFYSSNISNKPPIDKIQNEITILKDKNDTLTLENVELKNKIIELNKKLTSQINLQKEKDDLKTLNDQLQSNIDHLQDENNKLEEQNNHLQQQITSLQLDNNRFRIEISELKKSNSIEKQQNNNSTTKTIDLLSEEDIQSLERIEEIGFGGGGKVTKVSKKKFYALKEMIVKKNAFKNLQHFIAEYEIMNLLNHPNILKTYGIFLSNENTPPSILLEYCSMNLEKAIEMKSLSNEEIVCCIYQIVEGMKYIHFMKIIHRDLKPTNILIANDGTIKIGDFGISKLMTVEEQSMTQGAGTQKYMAPEIINEEEHYDEKVDVYSFGVLLYFVLSNGEIPKIKIGDILKGKKAELPSYFTSFSKKLINECWNFESSDRPSFETILHDIDKNNYKLLDLSNIELKNVESFVEQHKSKIPPYNK